MRLRADPALRRTERSTPNTRNFTNLNYEMTAVGPRPFFYRLAGGNQREQSPKRNQRLLQVHPFQNRVEARVRADWIQHPIRRNAKRQSRIALL